MLVNAHSSTFTASSGAASANIDNVNSEIKQIYLNATTGSTTFDVTLTNAQNVVVYQIDNITGTVLENVEVPSRGNLTLAISNASVDEVFNYYIGAVERYA